MAATDVGPSLTGALDALYESFGGYRFRPDMPVCRHCVAPTEVAALAGPVRALPPGRLERFAWQAVTTWGGPDDFRRLLPRLAHLAAAGDLDVPLALLGAKAVAAGWAAWPDEERAAVLGFVDALWDATLRHWPARPDAADCISLADLLAGDLGPALERWHRLLEPGEAREPALRHLVSVVERVGAVSEPAATRNLLWRDGSGGGSASLVEWITGPTTAIQLERAVFDYAESPLGTAAAAALRRIRPD